MLLPLLQFILLLFLSFCNAVTSTSCMQQTFVLFCVFFWFCFVSCLLVACALARTCTHLYRRSIHPSIDRSVDWSQPNHTVTLMIMPMPMWLQPKKKEMFIYYLFVSELNTYAHCASCVSLSMKNWKNWELPNIKTIIHTTHWVLPSGQMSFFNFSKKKRNSSKREREKETEYESAANKNNKNRPFPLSSCILLLELQKK